MLQQLSYLSICLVEMNHSSESEQNTKPLILFQNQYPKKVGVNLLWI
jgi:hypothetical protein